MVSADLQRNVHCGLANQCKVAEHGVSPHWVATQQRQVCAAAVLQNAVAKVCHVLQIEVDISVR